MTNKEIFDKIEPVVEQRGSDFMTTMQGKLLFPFIAPPNGGKGTQTNALSKKFEIPRIDMGGMLREIAKEDSALGREIRDRQANGRLVDTPIVLQVLKAGLIKLAAANQNVKGFILDGFPRNLEQGEGLFSLCNEMGARIAKVFYLKVPEEEIMNRAVNRRICPEGGEIYNLSSKPPANPGVCDVHNVQLVVRNDDMPDKVRERLRSFEDETRPVLNRFEQSGHIENIDGNRPEQEITEEISAKMQPFLSLTPATSA
jgi:adenylate kinase